MDIYRKDMKLKQIREQIELNKNQILMKGGNIKINDETFPSIKDIYEKIKNDKKNKEKEKKELFDVINNLVNDLEKSILKGNLPKNTIEKMIKEKNRLLKIIIE